MWFWGSAKSTIFLKGKFVLGERVDSGQNYIFWRKITLQYKNKNKISTFPYVLVCSGNSVPWSRYNDRMANDTKDWFHKIEVWVFAICVRLGQLFSKWFIYFIFVEIQITIILSSFGKPKWCDLRACWRRRFLHVFPLEISLLEMKARSLSMQRSMCFQPGTPFLGVWFGTLLRHFWGRALPPAMVVQQDVVAERGKFTCFLGLFVPSYVRRILSVWSFLVLNFL